MLYSAAHNACVYNTQVPERILACLPEARPVQAGLVAVPCDLRSMQIMRYLGYSALSPILNDYHWPSNRLKVPAPFDHQRQMAAFLTLHPRAFNLSDIGTGKTLGTLWALDYLMRRGAVKRCLILSPLSTIYRVWQDEIFVHFLNQRKCNVLYGDRAKRLQLLRDPADFYVINHDGLGIGSKRGQRGIELGELASYVRDNPEIDAIVVDEGSVYKDSGTTRYRILKQVAQNKPYLWWLTGTPTPNEPTDAWSQVKIVRPDFTESQVSFRDRTMTKVSTFKWVPRRDSAKIVADVMQPAIRFHRDECIDLPPLMVETRDVELTKDQKAALDELKKQLRLQIADGSITAVNEAALRLKFIQVACGAVYGDKHEVHRIDCAPRLSVLEEIIEQTNDKLLIFAPLTGVINLLYSELSKRYACAKVIGDVSATQRNEIFRAFQQEASPRIIIADPRTMAHGLTLTAAATIVWYGPTDQPEVYQQANGRINRPGQTKSMLVVRLAATQTEREIFRRLDNKDGMQGLILDLIRGE